MKWSEVEFSSIEVTTTPKDRTKYTYNGGRFKFQIPRGFSQSGLNAYKSMNVDMGASTEFVEWWARLEDHLCHELEPFKSNMTNGSLRVKIDDKTNVFNREKEIRFPSVEEGLFRNQEVMCQVDIDGRYFYNDVHGLVVKCTQLVFFDELHTAVEPLKTCAFIDD
jgi:hypothetical protein